MKKFLSAVLALMMIIGCASFVSAKEPVIEGTSQVALAIDDVVVTDATQKIKVPVNIKFAENFDGIIGITLKFTFDTTKLSFDKAATSIDYPVGATITSININKSNVITVQFAAEDLETGSKEDGVFVTLAFDAVEGAQGDAVVEFSGALKVSQVGNVAATYNTTNGKVTLPAPEAEKYDVAFEAGIAGVTDPDAMNDVESGTEIDLPELPDTDSFRFLGWQIDGEGDVFTGKYTVTADTSFIAAWAEIVYYTVSFNEGDFDDVTVEAGEEIDLPSMDDTADYTFGGWSDGEDTYTDKYTVTGNITLTAVWNEIIKYTVTYSEGAEPETVVAGQSVTLPTLTNSELSFKGWKVGDTDEILAGGAAYIPTASVLLTAVWGGGKKVYIDTNGDDANNGLTKDTPVKTLKRVQEIILADVNGENTLDTIVVVEKYEKKNEGTGTNDAATDNFLKGVGKKIYITGLTPDSVFDMHWNNANGAAGDSHLRIATDVEFNNITFVGSGKDGGPMAMGYELTFGENVTASGNQGMAIAHYNDIYKDGGILTINSGAWGRVHFAGMSGAKVYGTTTVNINGGTVTGINNGHGWRNNNIVYGANYVNINGGNVGLITLHAVGTASVTSYAGLRYFTINDGTVGNITTTGKAQATYKDGDVDKFVNTTIRDGVTVFEVNGGTVGTFATVGEDDDATRVIINNADAALVVEDTGAIVLNVKNAKLHAETTGFGEDGKPTYEWAMNNTAVLDWAKTVELTGFSYELPEDASFNAVKVGDKTYMLADLADGLIPAPEAAGAYDVVFTNVFKVTIGEETTLVEEGDTINLERLPQNGDLKHIGWATTEGATEATINHTTDYAPTADVTLYPVWAAAVYFTATFESAHGEVPAAISKIDDNEDGVADEAIVFPGYEGKQDEHFTFAGWFDKAYAGAPAPEGAGVPTYNEGDTLVLDGNKTFIAKWTEDAKATVTYVDTVATAPEAVTDYVGEEIEVAAPGTVEGFEFLGWTDGENVYQAGDKLTITVDVTLTAKWGVKVAVDANGAKGTAPVIGGEIGEEIDLPTSVELTYVNHTFVGFALSADGEVITGKYTVNPEDTLYAIWEETVADAAIITTKVTYYTGTGNYLVDVYYYGKDANTVAFGYEFDNALEFVGFAPANGFSVPHASVEVIDDGYYMNVIANENGGRIAGADKTEETAIHLGTITFTYTGEEANAAPENNLFITAPASEVENIASAEYFLYTPAVFGLEVIGLPVVFDEAFTFEVIRVEYPVLGSVKVVREDGVAPKNFTAVKVLNAAGLTVKTIEIEDADTVTEDGVFNFEIKLPEGEYTLVFDKVGYLEAAVDVTIEAQEGAEDKAYEELVPTEIALVELVAGDVVGEFGVIDLLDFAGITSSFGRGDLTAEQTIALDINEDGVVTVDDLLYIKHNFSATAE